MLALVILAGFFTRPNVGGDGFSPDQIAWKVVGSNAGFVPGQPRNITNPMEFAVEGSRVYFVERLGALRSFNLNSNRFTLLHQFEVFTEFEDGLIGLALDPGFATNHWLYVFRSMPATSLDDFGRKFGLVRVARFKVAGDMLDPASEEVIIEIQTQRDCSRHSAGSLCFDGDGNLLIALGDNTEWNESLGYAPIDERLGRDYRDAQRTAANSNSPLGKILRIRVRDGGGYSIPSGNLFPPGTPQTLPEIFVMGVRNPYRIHWDHKGRHLWWCDVGPDALMPSKDRGPAGYDEINCTRTGGFFGWPYFIADNKPYPHFNFETRKSGDNWSVAKPANLSPNNNGMTALPEAQAAKIYYGHAPSTKWTNVNGGLATCAIMGPVYHFDPHLASTVKLPKSLDNCVFIADWSRNWLVAAKLDEQGELAQVKAGDQQFFALLKPNQLLKPIDLELGQDGALYILEYGTYWVNGPDARISRLIGVTAPATKSKSANGRIELKE